MIKFIAVALLVSTVIARLSLDYFWFGSTLLYPFLAPIIDRGSAAARLHFASLCLAVFVVLAGVHCTELIARSAPWCDADGCVALPDSATHRALNSLRDKVRPGDRTFVQPFCPLLARLLRMETVGFFLYLQPTLMSEAEESVAAEDLKRLNPRWIIRVDAAPSLYRALWPGTVAVGFPNLDAQILQQYKASLFAADRQIFYQLMERRDECVLP